MRVIEVTVPTNGVWVCFADASSEVYAPDFFSRHPNAASFVTSIARLSRSGTILKQEVIIDGTFRFRILVVSHHEALSPPTDGERRQLRLPSGILEIRTGDLLAHPEWRIAVAPGTYDAWVQWSVDEECKHYEIASAADYPEGDGPDGIITLRHLSG